MDTMELTKIVGGLCAATLVLLLTLWAGDAIYYEGEGHGEELATAYPIEMESEGEQTAAAEEGPSFEEMLASADVAKGAKVFSKCKACHKLEDGANGTGPFLFNLVGRAKASVSGFGYSEALTSLGGEWDVDALNEFLTKPSAYAKGTKMSFAGLKKLKDRANLIAYLQTVK